MMFLRFIRLGGLFLWNAESCSLLGELATFYFCMPHLTGILAIMSKAAPSLCWNMYFHLSWGDTQKWNCWLVCKWSCCMFSVLKNCRTVSQTILSSHWQSTRIPVYPHSCRYLSLSVFLTKVFLTSAYRCLLMALICISLMTTDVKHLFTYLLAICISSLMKCLSNFLPIFKLAIFLLLNYSNFLYNLDMSPLSAILLAIIFLSVCVLTFFFFCLFFSAAAAAYRGRTGAGRHHSSARSEPCLWPTPQLTAVLDP